MIEDYLQRLSNRGISLEVHSLRGGVQFYEARLGALKGELILMDETGEMHDSEEFAAWLADSALSTEQIHIAVAAAEGFSADIKSQATALFSLSLLTMPHELAAVVLMEQLYRASEINRGSPYHRSKSDGED